MKIGFMLPMFGPMATHENMFDMAQLAEERGFESVWAPDHVIMPTRIKTTYPYSRSGDYIADPKGAHLEPFVSLSYIAGCTRRVRLGFTFLDTLSLVKIGDQWSIYNKLYHIEAGA